MYPNDFTKIRSTPSIHPIQMTGRNVESVMSRPVFDTDENGPRLMANMSISKLNQNKEVFQKLADELDIDKILQKEDRKDKFLEK